MFRAAKRRAAVTMPASRPLLWVSQPRPVLGALASALLFLASEAIESDRKTALGVHIISTHMSAHAQSAEPKLWMLERWKWHEMGIGV